VPRSTGLKIDHTRFGGFSFLRERERGRNMTANERHLLELNRTLQEVFALLEQANRKVNHAITLRHRIAIHDALSRKSEPCPGCDNPDHEERE
jgi:hypothetical protein